MSGDEWDVNSLKMKEFIHKQIDDQWDKHKYLNVKIRTGKQRTPTQNRAMRLYCDKMSKALNAAGYTVAMTLSKPLEIPWTKDLFVELIWRTVQQAITGHRSTKEPTRLQYIEIYDSVNVAIIDRCNGVSEEWPVKKDKE